MKRVEFSTPDIDEPHPHHPEAHSILSMFFRCLDELPDSTWADIDTRSMPGESGTVFETRKVASCQARGLELRIESVKSLSSARPYSDAAWTESATFMAPLARSADPAPLARFVIQGSGKIGPDDVMARHSTALKISVFDAKGESRQLSPEHWERALAELDLEASYGAALIHLRDSSESLFDSFISRLRGARSQADASE